MAGATIRSIMDGSLSETRQRFAAVTAKPNEELDLALAALLVAGEEYPGLVIEEYRERLGRIAFELGENADFDVGGLEACRRLSDFFTRHRGFRGDDENYYDARNSYLNEVMDRGLGSPVTLGIIYSEVAGRVGLDLQPILFPSHFLLRLRGSSDGDIFIDPYTGRLLDLAGCRDLLSDLYGGSRRFRESLVAPGTKRQVLARLLQDLKFIYLRENNLRKAARTLELLTLLSPWDLEQLRERGLLYSRIGNVDAAAADLQAYLDHAPPGAMLEPIKETLRKIARR